MNPSISLEPDPPEPVGLHPSENRPSKAKRFGHGTLKLAVCALLMAWIFHAIFHFEAQRTIPQADWQQLSRIERWKFAWTHGPNQVVKALREIKPRALVLSLLVMGSTILVGMARWRLVLQVHGLHLAWSRTAEISLVAHFFNSFLLGSTGGDVMRAIYAARETHHKKTEAVVTVFVDRILGFWSLLVFGCFMMLPNLELIRSHRGLKLLCGVMGMMTLACTLIVVMALRGGLARRWVNARAWLRRLPKGSSLEKSLEACRRFGSERMFLLKSMIFSTVLNALCVIHVQVIADGLDLPMAWRLTALVVPVITAIIAVPVTPSGLGIRETLFVYLLNAAPLHLDATKAFSLSVIAYGGSLFWSMIGGLIYLTFRRKHHLLEVAHAPPRSPS